MLIPGPVFDRLLEVTSDYALPITHQVTEVTCPVVGRAQPELTPSIKKKTGSVLDTQLSKSIQWFPSRRILEAATFFRVYYDSEPYGFPI